jgi:hypothetical protein
MYRWSALDDAEAYRASAAEQRRRGTGSTVRVYATTAAMERARGGNVGSGTWEHVLFEARLRWQMAREDACEDYLRGVFPERYEGFDL